MKSVRIMCFALVVAGCGSTGGAGSGSSSMPSSSSVGTQAAASALASKLGIPEKYVSEALTAAQSAFSSGKKTADDKVAAARLGVDTAANQAAADGKPFTEPQKTGLLDELKNMI